jgi:hypothetical protein
MDVILIEKHKVGQNTMRNKHTNGDNITNAEHGRLNIK